MFGKRIRHNPSIWVRHLDMREYRIYIIFLLQKKVEGINSVQHDIEHTSECMQQL